MTRYAMSYNTPIALYGHFDDPGVSLYWIEGGHRIYFIVAAEVAKRYPRKNGRRVSRATGRAMCGLPP